MIRLTPGGPFSDERNLDPDIEAAMKEQYHLDKPLLTQYTYFLGNLIQGDLGPSFKHKARTVNEIIKETLPPSIIFGSIAYLLALTIGIGLGMISALYHQKIADGFSMTLVLLGMSIPTFVIGPILQLIFSVMWKFFPLAGYEGFSSISYLILPSITLAAPFAARIARLTRSGVLEVIHQDYVRTARAKGLAEKAVLIHHVLRGALLPVVSFTGPALAQILTGSLVIEKVFQIPGLGREFIEAALNRDYTLVMGTVIVYGAFIVACNLIADIAYALLDPRVEME